MASGILPVHCSPVSGLVGLFFAHISATHSVAVQSLPFEVVDGHSEDRILSFADAARTGKHRSWIDRHGRKFGLIVSDPETRKGAWMRLSGPSKVHPQDDGCELTKPVSLWQFLLRTAVVGLLCA